MAVQDRHHQLLAQALLTLAAAAVELDQERRALLVQVVVGLVH
jgi:hypothetical protein